MIVAAMNPADTMTEDARMAFRAVAKQARRISCPIVDRLDLWIEPPLVPHETLAKLSGGELSPAVRGRESSSKSVRIITSIRF